jgi:hypothetical protein
MGRLLYLSHKTEHLPGVAIFGRDMFFDVPYLANWSKIGEYRQKQTDKNTVKENSGHIDWDY